MSIGPSTVVQFSFLPLAIGAMSVAPFWLVASDIARLRRKQGGQIRFLPGLSMLLFAAFAIDSFFGPWHKKILDQGTAPDGRAYVLLQTDGGEPFQIRLYVCDDKSGWVFHFVSHEVFPWRSGGHVEFSADSATAQVFHGSKVFKTIEIISTGKARPESPSPPIFPEDTPNRFPANQKTKPIP